MFTANSLQAASRIWLVVVTALLLLAGAAKPSPAQHPPEPSHKPFYTQWQKVHKARVVLFATLATRESGTLTKNEPLLLELHSVQVLKGTLPRNADVVQARYFLPYLLSFSAPGQSLRHVQNLYNQPVVVFVEAVGPAANEVSVMGALDETIIAAQSGDADAIRAEVQNQAAIAAWFPASFLAKPNKQSKGDKKVKEGLDRLVRDAPLRTDSDVPANDAQKRAQAIIEEMEKWGPDAVPALVRNLGDRRDLPIVLLGFTNPPGFWEEKYYSHPKKVVDALVSLLFVLTRADISAEQISGGGTEAQRAAVTQAWHVYLFYTHFGGTQRNACVSFSAYANEFPSSQTGADGCASFSKTTVVPCASV